MLPMLDVKLSATWQDALDGYELHSLSAAPRSVRKRLADVRIMAKHLTVVASSPRRGRPSTPWLR